MINVALKDLSRVCGSLIQRYTRKNPRLTYNSGTHRLINKCLHDIRPYIEDNETYGFNIETKKGHKIYLATDAHLVIDNEERCLGEYDHAWRFTLENIKTLDQFILELIGFAYFSHGQQDIDEEDRCEECGGRDCSC